ncbi:MAG: rhomboid family intramembrane serine protease, partial [Nitrososphaerota archaeon]|nr:rhomboid family intramembrane serine protease [Nitrososphaerota archaeon]
INVCPPMVGFCGKATLFLAQDNGLVLYGHQYYQMFTSILVTDSVLDAGFNAIAVLIFDWLTEDSLNKTRYFAIFFGSALLGNLMTMLQGANYASAGASGGIFGLFAALVAFSSLKQRKIEAPPAILFIIVFFGSSILPDVNYVAHIGGAVGGFIAAGLMYDSVKPSITEYSFAYESKTISVAIVAGLILIACIASIVQFILFVWR